MIRSILIHPITANKKYLEGESSNIFLSYVNHHEKRAGT